LQGFESDDDDENILEGSCGLEFSIVLSTGMSFFFFSLCSALLLIIWNEHYTASSSKNLAATDYWQLNP
jgi:hypothetical protein